MTVDNSSDRRNALVSQEIKCPVCGKTAHAFRIRLSNRRRTLAGEFYHAAAVCACTIFGDARADLTLAQLDAYGSRVEGESGPGSSPSETLRPDRELKSFTRNS